MSRRSFLAAGAAAGTLSLVSGRGALAAKDGTLVVRNRADIQVLDPLNYLGYEQTIMEACLGALTRFAPGDTWGWMPSEFVEGIEQSDERTIAFTLKPGMLWTGDYGEVTTEDVKYSFERVRDRGAYKDEWALLDTVEAVTSYEGVIRLKQPFAPIWYTTLCWGSGMIVCKEAVEAAGGAFTVEFPATCGPYVIAEWQPKQYLDLALSPVWRGAKPQFERIRVIPMTDDQAAELAYEAGELDYTKVPTGSVPRLRADMPEDSELLVRPSISWTWLGINTEHPTFQDPRVRKAVQYAIDVEQVLEAAYSGLAEPATGVIAPSLLGYRPKRLIGKPDLGKAKALLAEAGVPDGFETELKLENRQDFLTAAQIIQADLAKIGIVVKITPLEGGQFDTLGLESEGDRWKELQMYLQSFGTSPDPSGITQWFVPEQVGIWNWERWNSPEFGELHRAAITELDEEKRAQMYHRMQDLMEESGAYVFLTHEVNAILHGSWLDPAVRPDGNTYFLPWFERGNG